MALTKPAAQAGFQSQATQAQATGSWYAGNLVKWRLGFLEKVGGWRRLTEEQFVAIIRKMHAWLDLDNRKNLLVGTDKGLQILVQDSQYSLGRQVALPGGYIVEQGPSNVTKFSVTNGSTRITVSTASVTSAGGTFFLQLPISIGGRVLPAGVFYMIKTVVPGVGFTFDMVMPALYTETDTYGIRLFKNDSPNAMTCTWKAHGLTSGSRFQFAQTTTVKSGTEIDFSVPAGTALSVDTTPTVDTFTFSMGSFGTGDGANTSRHQVYDGCVADRIADQFTVGTVIGVSVLSPLGNPQSKNWFLDNLGENGLALRTGGPLQIYTPPIQDGPFTTIVGSTDLSAPQMSNGMFVAMPQAQVILLGSEVQDRNTKKFGTGEIDPLLVRWSHVGTYDVWTAAVGNQAGSYHLSRGSKIVGGIQAPQTTLILTDNDCWAMSYIGPPLVYGFTIIGTGCGLLAEDAIGCLGKSTYWLSEKGFWQFGDGGVQPLLCSVYDFIFDDLDHVNVGKCFAAANSATNEIAFFFPSLKNARDVSGNLLQQSQAFAESSVWIATNALVQRASRFTMVYVYEPQYIIYGWFDDVGLPLASWHDRDLQGKQAAIILAPDDTDTAINLIEFAVAGEHSIGQEILKQDRKTTFTLSIYAHNTSTRNLTLRASSANGEVYATFNPVSGASIIAGTTTPQFTFISAYSQVDELATGTGPGGDGWRRYVMTFTSDSDTTLTITFNLTNGTMLNYLGDSSKAILIWGAQLDEGGLPLPYDPTTDAQEQNECTHYVKYNTVEKAWDSGEYLRGRTAWIDNSVWGTPLGADLNKRVQQHEIGYDDDDQAMTGVFAETGFSQLGDGSVMLLVDQVHPDFKWFGRGGALKIRLRAMNYPGGPQHLYGPYSMTPDTQYFTPHVRAGYMAIRYEWEPLPGYSARVGVTTYRVKPAGKRP